MLRADLPPPLPLPPHPQGPSLTQSAAARRHPCLPSTWRRRPSPAANHRAPSPTSRAFLSAPLRLVTEGRTGKATPPSSILLIMPAPPSLFGSSRSRRYIASQAMNFAAVAESCLSAGDFILWRCCCYLKHELSCLSPPPCPCCLACQNTCSVSLTLTVKPKFFSLRNLRFVQCCLL